MTLLLSATAADVVVKYCDAMLVNKRSNRRVAINMTVIETASTSYIHPFQFGRSRTACSSGYYCCYCRYCSCCLSLILVPTSQNTHTGCLIHCWSRATAATVAATACYYCCCYCCLVGDKLEVLVKCSYIV
jgi:hypothetical protein